MNQQAPCHNSFSFGDYILVQEVEYNLRNRSRVFARKGKLIKSNSVYHSKSICDIIKEKCDLYFMNNDDKEQTLEQISIYFSSYNKNNPNGYLSSDININDRLLSSFIVENIICIKHEETNSYIYNKLDIVKVPISVINEYGLDTDRAFEFKKIIKGFLYQKAKDSNLNDIDTIENHPLYFNICANNNNPIGTFFLLDTLDEYYLCAIDSACIIALESV